jgi:hypothetical protein
MAKKAKYMKAAGCLCGLGRMGGMFKVTNCWLFMPMMTSKASRAMIKSVLKINFKFMTPVLFATIGKIAAGVNILGD